MAPAYSYNAPTVTRVAKFSNAYMLVYVRASDWPRMMSEVAREDSAEHLRERFEVCAHRFVTWSVNGRVGGE